MNCPFCQQPMSQSDELHKCRRHQDIFVGYYKPKNKLMIYHFDLPPFYCMVDLTNKTCSYHSNNRDLIFTTTLPDPIILDDILSHINRLNNLKSFF